MYISGWYYGCGYNWGCGGCYNPCIRYCGSGCGVTPYYYPCGNTCCGY